MAMKTKLCECGCGKEIKNDRRFVNGHNWKGKKRISPFKGKKRSLESRRKQSESLKGKPSPMKGKKQSKESRKQISESRKGKKHSLETRKRISKSMKGKNKGRKRSLKTRKQMSISANNRISPKYKSGYFYSEKMQKEIFYQSSLELRALEMFEKDENIWSIERYNLGSIKYRLNGDYHSYNPDYFLNEKIVYEVKALWKLKDEKNLAKIKAAKKYCKEREFEFRVLTEKDL